MITTPTEAELFSILKEVKDPEIEVVDIVELGIVRAAEFKDGVVKITITPTYSGCPAMEAIENQIKEILSARGFTSQIHLTYNPPWTTDWISEETKEKLRKYGISPPSSGQLVSIGAKDSDESACPFCGSKSVQLQSQFGSTACKSLYSCLNCSQPFEHFKKF